MPVDADVRAFDALSQHPRVADLTAIARSQMTAAAQTRRLDGHAAQVMKLAGEMGLSHDEALTPFGNALDVLARGPEGEAELGGADEAPRWARRAGDEARRGNGAVARRGPDAVRQRARRARARARGRGRARRRRRGASMGTPRR